MNTLRITSNRNWREFVNRWDVPSAVMASQFDWTDEDHAKDGDYTDGFFKYRGCWYHLGGFMRDGAPEGWDGYAGDSYFSGVVIKLSEDGETFQVGTAIVSGA